jgi:hypothetical protein
MANTPATDLTNAVATEKNAAVAAATSVETAAVTFFQKYWYFFALGTLVVGNLVGVVFHI